MNRLKTADDEDELDRVEEEILSHIVSDEALEAAGGTEKVVTNVVSKATCAGSCGCNR